MKRAKLRPGKWAAGAALLACLLLLCGAAQAAPAEAAPIWKLDLHHSPTNFAPGGQGEFWVDLDNVGDAETSGPFVFSLQLPPGLSRASAGEISLDIPFGVSWSCPGSPGDQSFTCTGTGGIPRHHLSRKLTLTVDVAPGASGPLTVTGGVSGGSAANSAQAEETVTVDLSPAGFGSVPGSFAPGFFASDGSSPDREAGSHPDLFSIPLEFNSVSRPTAELPARKLPVENVRDAGVDLPAGLTASPSAVGECEPAQFAEAACPLSSQVGRVDVGLAEVNPSEDVVNGLTTGVFNLVHPRGVLSDLGFNIFGNQVHLRTSLDPAHGYAIRGRLSNLNETIPIFYADLTLWGVPGAPAHDSERCSAFSALGFAGGDTSGECQTEAPPRPFLTLPAGCGPAGSFSLDEYDSWDHPGIFGAAISYRPTGDLVGCGAASFEPVLEVRSLGNRTSSPSGLAIRLHVPQTAAPGGLATPPMKELRLTLPPGMHLSPSAAAGLGSCSPREIGLGSNDPPSCPGSSRIGEASLRTPLLAQPLQGSVYLATPGDNPSGSTFALYLVLQDVEARGIVLKLPGRLLPDPATGQITAEFDGLPQLPLETLDLTFPGGDRALLASPSGCGSQLVSGDARSYAEPDVAVSLSDRYELGEGPGGEACGGAAGAAPFAPQASLGGVSARAGAKTPLVFRLRRSDGEQGIGRIGAVLPPGVAADVAGVPVCPEGEAATGCPEASRVGQAVLRVGVGPLPLPVTGRVFLAGPYEGAPFSLSVEAPFHAGPFDLGVLRSRLAVALDPHTGQLSVSSDTLPAINAGVPIDYRSIYLILDRPGFIRNPTSCEPMRTEANAVSTGAAVAKLGSRFQVGDCAALRFEPRLGLRLAGALGRNGHPALRMALGARLDEARLASASVVLPQGQLLDVHRLGSLCARGLPPGRCPAASRLGHATIRSPLLPQPLRGPVYLRAPSHRYPDLVAEVEGAGVRLVLHGRTGTTRDGRLRFRLLGLPDLPLSQATVVLAGGRRGIVANSRPLCGHRQRGYARLAGQNGKRANARPVLRLSGCASRHPRGKR